MRLFFFNINRLYNRCFKIKTIFAGQIEQQNRGKKRLLEKYILM